MKKVFFILLFALCLISCGSEEKKGIGNPNERNNNGEKKVGGTVFYPVLEQDVYEGGIHYKIFYQHNGGMSVINYTQDSLNFVNSKRDSLGTN